MSGSASATEAASLTATFACDRSDLESNLMQYSCCASAARPFPASQPGSSGSLCNLVRAIGAY